MKQAIFLVTHNGCDGKARESIVFASVDEHEREAWFDASPNKNFYRKVDRVIDLEAAAKEARKKLNGLDVLALRHNSVELEDKAVPKITRVAYYDDFHHADG